MVSQRMEATMQKAYRTYYSRMVLILVGVGWYVFFQFCYPYHFFFQEQNQLFLLSQDYVSTYFDRSGGMARLVGDFLTQFYYYLYAGAAIQTLCQLCIGVLLYTTLRRFTAGRVVALLCSVTAMSLVGISHFSTGYRLSSSVSILGWVLAAWLVTLLTGWRLRVTAALCALLPAYWLFALPEVKALRAPDFVLEKNFAIDSEYYFGNYDKVVEYMRNSDGWNDQMLFFYNLVMARRGELPDHLLDYTPNYLGTFEEVGPETPLLTIRNMNELYWLLGDMTFTERAAMMANVFSRENRNVRMIRRLAECNIVSGDTLAAEKYLRILDKTLLYRKWARQVREHGKQIYHDKMLLVNTRDTIAVTDNAHFLMMQLLDAHPDNTPCLDYILCSTLLLKDIDNFKRDYDRYCTGTGRPRLKTLYQEALCIYLAGTKASPEEWQRYIQSPGVVQRFREYNVQRGHRRFKGTYWYYFDRFK